MRIIAGELKGRNFKTPRGFRTHPMGDRVKVALFNTLGPQLAGKRVLDAYGGSGALSFEAVSRGAAFVQVVERDRSAFKTIIQNIEALNLGPDIIQAARANCATWSSRNKEEMFDIILVDPPYDELNLSTVKRLSKHLTQEGLMVISHTGREAVPTVSTLVVVDVRMYGGAALSYCRPK